MVMCKKNCWSSKSIDVQSGTSQQVLLELMPFSLEIDVVTKKKLRKLKWTSVCVKIKKL